MQEDFAQGFGDLLQKLDDEIAECKVVVHLVGNMAGARPTPNEVRRLESRHPTLFTDEPTLRKRANEPLPIAYTQWEFYLAYQHHKDSLVFLAASDAPRSPCHKADLEQNDSQERHRQVVRALGKDRDTFVNQENLCRMVLVSLIRQGVTPLTGKVVPEEHIEEVRVSINGVVEDIAHEIEHSADARSPGSETYFTALETVANARGIGVQTLVRLLDEHEAAQCAALEQDPEPSALCNFALTQLALGEYEAAMLAASQAAHKATQLLQGAPTAPVQREIALNAHLLWAEAARLSRNFEQAIIARNKGGELIDRTADPFLWASFHEPTADLLFDLGRYEEGDALLREVISIHENVGGEESPDLRHALYVRRKLYIAQNDFGSVEKLARRLLSSLELDPTEEARNEGAGVLALLGLALNHLCRWDEAERALRNAVAIQEKSPLGNQNPNLGAALDSLAQLLSDTGRLKEAEHLARRALTVDEIAFGNMDPNVGFRVLNLGSLMSRMDRFSEAEDLFRRGLAINEYCYGRNHEGVAVALFTLGRLLTDTNRIAEAEPVLQQALTIRASSLEVSRRSPILVGLTDVYFQTNRLAEAESSIRTALEAAEAAEGSESIVVAGCIEWLATVLIKTKRSAEALPLVRRAVDIAEKRCGADNSFTAGSLRILAKALIDLNKSEEAEPLLRRALLIQERIYGADHSTVAYDLHWLARALQEMNRLAEGEALVRRAWSIHEKVFGPQHPSVAADLDCLAGFIERTERYKEAETLRRAVQIVADFKATTGFDFVHSREYISNYIALLVGTLKRPPGEVQAELTSMGLAV